MTTQEALSQAHPKIREALSAAIQEVESSLTGRAKFRITSVYRDPKEQEALYAKGRTAPGEIVTNAPPGSSYHEYSLAVDFTLVIDGKELSWNTQKDWDGDSIADWMEVVAIFKKHGFKWGGDWKGKLKDGPHFDMTFGYGWRTLKKKRAAKDFIPGTNYVNI